MSLILDIQDYLSGAKGTHYRNVGKLTIRFCKRASKLSANEHQRRVLMSAAISADEVIAALLGLDNKRNVEAFKERHSCNRLHRDAIVAAMRSYLSALLILCSIFKDSLLKKMEMTENDFVAGWCSVFEYLPEDMKSFDDDLSTTFRSKGMDGLVEVLGRQMANTLFQEKHPLSEMEAASLRDWILVDVAAIKMDSV